MRVLEHTTLLEAVNTVLSTVGNSPVAVVDGSGIEDADIAYRLLQEASKRVCLRSFDWNTDSDYPLDPDEDGFVSVPAGALKVDPQSPATKAVVRRNPETEKLGLWDKAKRTFKFSSSVPCEITWGFPFEDLPEIARDFIVLSAGRTFQKRFVGSQVLDRYSAEDVAVANAALQASELRSRDYNLFRDNPAMAASTNRMY
jgi:hypothetical protein